MTLRQAQDEAPALLAEIEIFLARTGTPPTVVGKLACHDGRLVTNLRCGRGIKPETAARVRDWMRANPAGVARQRGTPRAVRVSHGREGDGTPARHVGPAIGKNEAEKVWAEMCARGSRSLAAAVNRLLDKRAAQQGGVAA